MKDWFRQALLVMMLPALVLVSCENRNEPFTVVWENIDGRRFSFSMETPDKVAYDSFDWQDDTEKGWVDIIPEGNTLTLEPGVHTLRVRGIQADGNATPWKVLAPMLANEPPEDPYCRFELLGKRSLIALDASDPDGDDITYEMEYSTGEGWISMEKPEGYHDFSLSSEGPMYVSLRVRARDSWDSVSDWVVRKGVVHALPEAPVVFPVLMNYDDKGLAWIGVVAATDAPSFGLAMFDSDGKKYREMDGAFSSITELMSTGSHGLTYDYIPKGGTTVRTSSNMWIPEAGETAFIRPVIFVMDDGQYRDAVGVVVDTSLSFEEMSMLSDRRALMKDLGLMLKRNRVPYSPVWSYLDEGNVLHIATTADSISFWHDADKGKMQAGMSMFRDMDRLESADLTGFDFSASESLEDMFRDCSALESVTFPEDICPILMKKGGMFQGTAIAEGNDVFVPYAPFASEERYVADTAVSWQEEYTAAGYDRGRWKRMTAVLEDRK